LQSSTHHRRMGFAALASFFLPRPDMMSRSRRHKPSVNRSSTSSGSYK